MSTVTQTQTTTSHPIGVLKIVPPSQFRSNGDPTLKKPPAFATLEEEREYLKGRLAAGFRILHKFGLNEGSAGHMSLRDPINREAIWLNAWGTSYGAVTASSLVLVDKQGNVIGGGDSAQGKLYNYAAYIIHHAVHEAAPHIDCAAHSHSLYGRAFSVLGRPLDVQSTDGTNFHSHVAYYPEFGGVVVEREEGERLAAHLGTQNNGLIMQSHGILSAGATVEAAVVSFIELEKLCRAQLEADTAGFLPPSSEATDLPQPTREERELMLYNLALHYFDEIEEECGGANRK